MAEIITSTPDQATNGQTTMSTQATLGATVDQTYLVRRQENVAVNRNDLEDIREFDGMQAIFSNLGMFLIAGASWLGLEKILEQDKFSLTPVISVCLLSVLGV